MSKELWFTNFERRLAENGWYDSHSDKAYEEAAEGANADLLNRDAPEKDDE